MSSSHNSRPMSGSRSLQASQSYYASASASRPFLNMLNPMSRQYQGYTQANQSLLEEDEENKGDSQSDEDEDLELGHGEGNVYRRDADTRLKDLSKSQGKRRVSWNPDASNVVHPNIKQEDKREDSESDGEVPQSFMIEATARKPSKISFKDKSKEPSSSRRQPLYSVPERKVPPILPTHAAPPLSIPPRPSEVDGEHTPRAETFSESSERDRPRRTNVGLDAYERALWNWVNVYNLDAFLQEVYYYYEGKGIYSIALARGLNLLTVGFVIGFSTFLLGCIDYSRIHPEKQMRLSEAIVGRCVSKFSGFTFLFFILFTAFYVWQIVSFVLGVKRLVDMYNFYTHLLKIPDADIQTISWPEIVRRIGMIRQDNPLTAISSKSAGNVNDTTTAKLDAHDIANRIMRQENYLIALFNKDLLDLRVPLPQMLKRFVVEEQGKGKMLTRALEWNLRFCLMEYLFDKHGKVRKVFLKSKNRAILIEGLKRRFVFMGILNAIFAPFIVLYLLMYSFFRYFEEYHKDPSTIGGRRYTSFAQWKFREFNELPHLFIRRLDESYPLANIYIGQFPNEKVHLIMRFIAFISGSFVAVLFLATVWDPDLVVHFEITPHRTILFYLTVFGSILAFARGMIPDENRVFDPEMLMTELITYTHYMPDFWNGQLHSKKVHQEFGELFAMKILIFVEELLSVVLTPFVLWFSLPACAPAIIDFFREFTVHVEGRGYVCSFAEFNFERHGNVKFGAPAQVSDKRMISNEGKMEKSFLTFKAANPEWTPDHSGSLYLSRMQDFSAAHPNSFIRRRQGVDPNTIGLTSPPSGPNTETSLADRAQEYDRALKQSQLAARKRGLGASTLGMSALAPGGQSLAGPSASSIFGAMAGAQTAVLGDSHGSVTVATGAKIDGTGVFDTPESSRIAPIPSGDLGPDGEISSGLGGSYVDGARRVKPAQEEEEDEGMEDGGVLGLLAQIYGRRDGPARVI
ncbi:putative transmembrane protein [Dendrothele bispora CBS 962.96]|uniref:Autophagy-related protein 9 n=1 Tax=Dendrothele bispora (strain CBS 962.96) TaxID=1314807 RepID=A0A4S8LHQ2_DENBC|nr:putative transmembrane protein [Dendrothele bispora CBS 962.96]